MSLFYDPEEIDGDQYYQSIKPLASKNPSLLISKASIGHRGIGYRIAANKLPTV